MYTPLEKTFLVAGRAGNLSLIKSCLQHNVNLNVADEAGNTALHYALLLGRRDIVSELLKHHINEHHQNKAGKTAVEMTDDTKMVVWFIQASRLKESQKLDAIRRSNLALRIKQGELSVRMGLFEQSTAGIDAGQSLLDDCGKQPRAKL